QTVAGFMPSGPGLSLAPTVWSPVEKQRAGDRQAPPLSGLEADAYYCVKNPRRPRHAAVPESHDRLCRPTAIDARALALGLSAAGAIPVLALLERVPRGETVCDPGWSNLDSAARAPAPNWLTTVLETVGI